MENETQNLQKNIKKIYWLNILQGFFFSIPVMVLFWQDNGLNLTQIMLLQSFYSIIAVTLEIPTGYLADIIGRKQTLVYSATAIALAISIYSVGHNFWQFLFAETLFAIGVSMNSGCASALVFDTLKNLKREDEFKKIWGHRFFLSTLAQAIASIMGGIIGHFNLRAAVAASIPFFALRIPVALTLKEPPRPIKVKEKSHIQEIFYITKHLLWKNKKLKWLFVYSGIIYAFNQAAFWLYQPYLTLTGLNIAYLGAVFAGFQLVAAVSGKYAHRLEEKLGQKNSLIMLVFLVSASFLLMSNFIFLLSFSFCFLQQFIRGFKDTVMEEYLNKMAGSVYRATILSVNGLLSKLFYAAIIPFVGWVADVYSLVQALSLLGITSLIIGVFVLWMVLKNKEEIKQYNVN